MNGRVEDDSGRMVLLATQTVQRMRATLDKDDLCQSCADQADATQITALDVFVTPPRGSLLSVYRPNVRRKLQEGGGKIAEGVLSKGR